MSELRTPSPAQAAGPSTIYDVARAAGVSIKTVSRVLNNEPNVSTGTRQAVLDAMTALRFRPNMAARGLASARTYLVGLLIDDATPAYLAGVQRGATERCRQDGFHLMVEPVASLARDAPTQMRALLADLRLEGLILTPPVCDVLPVLDALDELGAHYVRIAPGLEPERSPRIEVDDRSAAAEMTNLLIGHGHREIGFVCGPRAHLAALRRHDGFIDALNRAGVERRPEWDVQGDFTFASGMAAAEKLLGGTPRPSAIFAANDDMALGVLAVALRMGLSAPDQISVAGFDDTQAAQLVWPRLTTVSQPIIEMGRAAADMLISRRGRPFQGDAPERRRLDYAIEVRESVSRR